jgi:hypothetical protein
MDLSRVHKKLDEAGFFLVKLTGEDERLSGETAFDFYLSAFNSAACSVDWRLRCEQGEAYKKWHQPWRSRLKPAEDGLMTFMADDRAAEVHRSGSRRTVGQETVELAIGEHRRSDGLHYVAGPPGSSVNIYKPTYIYTTDSISTDIAEKCAGYKAALPQRVVDACTTYLTLLRRMVADFEAECGPASSP